MVDMMNTTETRTYLVMMTVSVTRARKFYAVPTTTDRDPVEWAKVFGWSKGLRAGTTVHHWTRQAANAHEAIADVSQCGIPADGSFELPDPMAVAAAARAKIGE